VTGQQIFRQSDAKEAPFQGAMITTGAQRHGIGALKRPISLVIFNTGINK
jgi:hypothetical protein